MNPMKTTPVPSLSRQSRRPAIWLPGLRKYGKIFRVSLIERMTYRGDFLFSTCLRFLPMVTTILLWTAIFAGSGKEDLNGFTYRQTIAYLLLVHISRMFSSMPGLASGIARDIREGTLKKYLLQPIDMLAYLMSYRAAHKVAYIAAAALPYALLFGLCWDYFRDVPAPDAITLTAYLASLVLGFLIGFFFEACIGMIGFWFLEVSSFLYVINTLSFFFSGHMFPLDMLSPFWAGLLKSLPFQYLAYFPAMVLLQKIHGPDLASGLLVEAAWVAGFIVLSRVLYRLGLRRYSAYGG
jgi:ABC-2 type transport system permease protein